MQILFSHLENELSKIEDVTDHIDVILVVN